MTSVRPSGDNSRSLAGNGTSAWKYIERAGWLAFHQAKPAVMKSPKNVAARIQPTRSHFRRGGGTLSPSPAREPASTSQRSSLARSLALRQRSSGSFARHFLMTRSSARGGIGWGSGLGGGAALQE